MLEIVECEGLTPAESAPPVAQLTSSIVFSIQQSVEQVLQRLAGRSSPAPPAPAPPRSEFDLDDLHRAFDHWVGKQKPTTKTQMETQAGLKRFILCTSRTHISAVASLRWIARRGLL